MQKHVIYNLNEQGLVFNRVKKSVWNCGSELFPWFIGVST